MTLAPGVPLEFLLKGEEVWRQVAVHLTNRDLSPGVFEDGKGVSKYLRGVHMNETVSIEFLLCCIVSCDGTAEMLAFIYS